MVTVRDSSSRVQSYQHDDMLINESGETTRLLVEGARIADETEEIGILIMNMKHMPYICLLYDQLIQLCLASIYCMITQ